MMLGTVISGRQGARALATLALAWAAAWFCVQVHAPLPWMLGPLLATSITSVLGAPTVSLHPLRNGAQWTVGAALGLYFTPQTMATIASLWWAIALGVMWALLLGWGFGAWLYRMNQPYMPQLSPSQMRATTYFAAAIGGASEMTLISEREHARADMVAASHSLRILLVTLSIPFAMQFSGLPAHAVLPAASRVVEPLGFVALALATGAGAWALTYLKRANPWFLGALLVSMSLSMSGQTWSGVPQVLINAAQLVIGVSLGVRFRAEFMRAAPRWLGTVALGTVGAMLACAGFAVLLAWCTDVPWQTLVLGTSPGGIAEMAITAKVLKLGVPMVTSFQVCRLVTVLLLVEPLYRRIYPRDAVAARQTALQAKG